MKRTTFLISLLVIGFSAGVQARSGQSPAIQQSTSTVESPPTSQPQPTIKKTGRREQMSMERGLDTTLPKDRKQRRLRPDSLRRGGATRVDTIR